MGGEQVEGRRAVRELLAAPRPRAVDVWLAEELDPSPVLDEIVRLATNRQVPIRRVSRARLEAEARTDAPQGVLAHARSLAAVDLADLAGPGPGKRGLGTGAGPGVGTAPGLGTAPGVATGPGQGRGREAGRVPFLVVLDGVTDPHNLGAILRTAACAGVTGVVVPRHRSAHITPVVAKAAAGAVEHMAMALVPGVPGALSELAGLGVWSVGLEAGGTTSLFDLDLASSPLALVLGAEGRGLGRLTRQRCDVLAAIPQPGPLASLNVAAAAAVACFEIARHRSGR